ncbi:hypothetical protein VTJ83DRAFT_4646 [Remersonia thermophila]|uniref:Uncharacterized protein n=1 Tax=Remersonia thermophila TaxID=72144 RepID=A0ABR4DAI9_9PEZI
MRPCTYKSVHPPNISPASLLDPNILPPSVRLSVRSIFFIIFVLSISSHPPSQLPSTTASPSIPPKSRRLVFTAVSVLMAFPTPPPSFPLEPPDFSRKAPPATAQHHPYGAIGLREALLDIRDKLHYHPHDLAAVGGRAHVNSLLLSVVEESAYGANEPADRTIVRLLQLAVHTCAVEAADDEAAYAHRYTRPHPAEDVDDDSYDASSSRVTWLPPARCEAREHLELYRNIAAYLASHPISSLYRDPALDATRQTLQRLCPRVNGLSRWTWTEGPLPPTMTPNGACGSLWGEGPLLARALPQATVLEVARPGKASSGSSRGTKAKKSSMTARRTGDQVQFFTPPSQSGDVGCDELDETLPTLPVSRPGRWGPRRGNPATLGWSPEATAPSCRKPAAVAAAQQRHKTKHTSWALSDVCDVDEKSAGTQNDATGGVGREAHGRSWDGNSKGSVWCRNDFRLRPEVVRSSRCCAMCAGSGRSQDDRQGWVRR